MPITSIVPHILLVNLLSVMGLSLLSVFPIAVYLKLFGMAAQSINLTLLQISIRSRCMYLEQSLINSPSLYSIHQIVAHGASLILCTLDILGGFPRHNPLWVT